VRRSIAVCCVVVSVASGPSVPLSPPPRVVLLTRAGCVLTELMRTRLNTALRALRRPLDYAVISADALPVSDRWRGYATPTILLGNHDVFALPAPTPQFEPTSDFEPT